MPVVSILPETYIPFYVTVVTVVTVVTEVTVVTVVTVMRILKKKFCNNFFF